MTFRAEFPFILLFTPSPDCWNLCLLPGGQLCELLPSQPGALRGHRPAPLGREGHQSSRSRLPGCLRCNRCLAKSWELSVPGMELSLCRRVTQSALEAALARPAAAPAWRRERLARAPSCRLEVALARLGLTSAEMPEGWGQAAVSHGEHSGDPG